MNAPFEHLLWGGSRYFVIFVDDYSGWTTLYTMKKKSEVSDCFKKYNLYAEKHTGTLIGSINVIKRAQETAQELKALIADHSGEYISKKFKFYLIQHDIQHKLTIKNTHLQSGVTERITRAFMDCVRSLMLSAKMNKKFWAQALSTAVHLWNLVISRSFPSNMTQHHR